MAALTGKEGLQAVEGNCDLCGQHADVTTGLINALHCSCKGCPDSVYHQDCLEKFLKSIKIERNRRSGYPCPRGRGKATRVTTPCPGKIVKSHPIIPTKKDVPAPAPAPTPAPAPARAPSPAPSKQPPQPPKPATFQIRSGSGEVKEIPGNKKLSATPTPAAAKVVRSAKEDKDALARAQLEAAKAAARAARAELGLPPSGGASSSAHAPATSRPASTASSARTAWGAGSQDSGRGDARPAVLPNVWGLRNPFPMAASVSDSAAAKADRESAEELPPAPMPAVPVRGAWLARAAAGAGRSSSGQELPPPPAALVEAVRRVVPEAAWVEPVARWLDAELGAEAAAYVVTPGGAVALKVEVSRAVDALIERGLLCGPGAQASSEDSGWGVSAEASDATLPVTARREGDSADGDGDGDAPRLTKSQRKNMKRAEKKRQKRDAGSTIRRLFEVEGDAEGGEGADGDSFATGRHSRPASQGVSVWGDASAPPSQAQGPGSRHTSSTEEQAGPVASPRLPDAGGGGSWAAVLPGVAGEAFQCLAARKVALLAGDLQRLAFSAPQAVAAVRLFGSDLLGAVTWLLDAKMRGAADEAALLLAAAQRPPQDVDLAKETAAIEALVAAGVPEEEVYEFVVACQGDMDAAVERIVQVHPSAAGAGALPAPSPVPASASLFSVDLASLLDDGLDGLVH